MAKFVYRMQNILDLKEKLESQEKIAYGIANANLLSEQEKLRKLFVRRAEYESQLKELSSGTIDVRKIKRCRDAISAMKSLIRDQMMNVQKAEKELEAARARLDEVMKDRKTHENLREKAFEQFKKELSAEENKAVDELVSYNYHKQ